MFLRDENELKSRRNKEECSKEVPEIKKKCLPKDQV